MGGREAMGGREGGLTYDERGRRQGRQGGGGGYHGKVRLVCNFVCKLNSCSDTIINRKRMHCISNK